MEQTDCIEESCIYTTIGDNYARKELNEPSLSLSLSSRVSFSSRPRPYLTGKYVHDFVYRIPRHSIT